jgi:hypothetical protein
MFVAILGELDFDTSRVEWHWDGLDQGWACRPPRTPPRLRRGFLGIRLCLRMSTLFTRLILIVNSTRIFSHFLPAMPYITIFLSHILPGRRGRCRFNQPGKYIKTKQSQLG